jgi:hypothetical protein
MKEEVQYEVNDYLCPAGPRECSEKEQKIFMVCSIKEQCSIMEQDMNKNRKGPIILFKDAANGKFYTFQAFGTAYFCLSREPWPLR